MDNFKHMYRKSLLKNQLSKVWILGSNTMHENIDLRIDF
jgi:hypothetical protein